MAKKLSQLPPFAGKELLMLAEKRGAEILNQQEGSAADAILIGLTDLILTELPRYRSMKDALQSLSARSALNHERNHE